MKKILLTLVLMALSLPALAAEKTEVVIEGVTVTSKSLAQALADYVAADSLAKGGAFIIEDAQEKSFVKLKPSKLDDGAHMHQLSKTSFLSWGEFISDSGEAYMLDFYFEWKEGHWKLNGPLSIFSKNKVKRYDWDEKGAFLRRLRAPIKP